MSAGFLLIHAKPSRTVARVLSWVVFAAGIAAYLAISHARHRENPEDRVTPTIMQMAQGMFDAALKPAEDDELQAGGNIAQRFFGSMLWKDTKATSRRWPSFDGPRPDDRRQMICSARVKRYSVPCSRSAASVR